MNDAVRFIVRRPRTMSKTEEIVLWVLTIGLPFTGLFKSVICPTPFSEYVWIFAVLAAGAVSSFRLGRFGSHWRGFSPVVWCAFGFYAVALLGWFVMLLYGLIKG